jgi:hypothetical protein
MLLLLLFFGWEEPHDVGAEGENVEEENKNL